MDERKTLDFLRGMVALRGELEPPTVEPVKFQVRTGVGMPSRGTMKRDGAVLVTWQYNVGQLSPFETFLDGRERALKKPAFRGDPLLSSWLYHGTFATKDGSGAVVGCRSLWTFRKTSGVAPDFEQLEKLADQASVATSFQSTVRDFILKLRQFAGLSQGKRFTREVLDPDL